MLTVLLCLLPLQIPYPSPLLISSLLFQSITGYVNPSFCCMMSTGLWRVVGTSISVIFSCSFLTSQSPIRLTLQVKSLPTQRLWLIARPFSLRFSPSTRLSAFHVCPLRCDRIFANISSERCSILDFLVVQWSFLSVQFLGHDFLFLYIQLLRFGI